MCTKIWALNEILAQFEYSGVARYGLKYYRSRRGSNVDFVLSHEERTYGVSVCMQETPSSYFLRASEAFLKKVPAANAIVFCPCSEQQEVGDRVTVIPWTFMA